MKNLITEKEAADQLGLPASRISQLSESGIFHKVKEGDIVLFKKEEIEQFGNSEEYKKFVKNGEVFVPQKDHYGTVTLFLFSLCAIVFLFSVFARRLYLLEFVVPPLAFIGLIFLGINLLKYYKDKEQRRKAAETAAETDRLLNQIERLEKQSKRNS